MWSLDPDNPVPLTVRVTVGHRAGSARRTGQALPRFYPLVWSLARRKLAARKTLGTEQRAPSGSPGRMTAAHCTGASKRNILRRGRSTTCAARRPMTLREWLPTAAEVAADLAHVPELPAEYDAWTAPWRGYELHFYSLERVRFFNGFAWSRASARAWHLPLGAVAAYALMIPLLRRVRRRVELRAFAQCWNFGLALFSAMGFCACAPVLLTELYRNGFYFTCCAPAPWYGGGVCGLFVALFIYSKFAELAPPPRPDEARAFFFSPRGRARRSTPPSSCWRSAASSSSTGGTTRRSCSTAGTRTARRSRPACGSRR